MEFTSIKELYRKLIPVFNVKKRLIQNSRYQHITNKDIWLYLTDFKWKKAHNLTLSDMVNDIITVELESINKSLGDQDEKI